MRTRRFANAAAFLALALLACEAAEREAPLAGGDADQRDAAIALARELDRIQRAADSIDRILHPLRLLRPAEESALRRYSSAQQLARARALGIDPHTPPERLEELAAEGRLARIEASTPLWVVRELDHSSPYLTPDAAAALTEIGRRFHARLRAASLPAFRLELSSALRDAASQADLRRTNPNAAAGTSTHQYGVAFDLAYNAFAEPGEPIIETSAAEAPWLEEHLERLAGDAARVVGARRAAELQAILGQVLLEMQREGKIMVTLERLQPVFHVTVARRMLNASPRRSP
jgi:hypothetical protein